MYKYVLFDLDGTLVDTGEGIMLSVKQTLEKMGLAPLSYEDTRSFIGPPLKDSFIQKCGLDENTADEAVRTFRAIYKEENLFKCALYDGMTELLSELAENGHTLIVATSKPTVFAKAVLEHLGIDKYFADVTGSGLDNKGGKKCDIIESIIRKFDIKDRASVVMIGDKEQDIIGANQCGVNSVGVLFGFGSFEELSAHNPAYIAETPADIAVYLTRKKEKL
ncbi:MAG: HAD hydrolase-like protein [Firmicutes bacterium]|nr:HAD hydrolase-like protein [Bacillota bacterium]